MKVVEGAKVILGVLTNIDYNAEQVSLGVCVNFLDIVVCINLFEHLH